MHIFTELVQKFGDKPILTWMHLFLAQVRCPRSIFIHVHESNNFIGTGGTIAGIGRYLKMINQDVKVILADPQGSGLYNKVSLVPLEFRCQTRISVNSVSSHDDQIKYGVMFDHKESEGTRRRHQVDTVVEGM